MSWSAHLTIPADLGFLNLIGMFVSETATMAKVSQDHVYNLRLAADEASTNVILHSYHSDPTRNFSLICSTDDNIFTIEVVDQGDSFQIEEVPEPDILSNLETRKIGGLGVFFIKKIMDSVQQIHEADGVNRLVMRKKI
jgi:serine/threonine-protein kinase RsbW